MFKPLLIISATVLSFQAHADQVAGVCPSSPMVSLNAVSKDRFPNDRISMTWTIRHESSESGRALQAVTQGVQSAVGDLKGDKRISQIRTDYQTFPQRNREGKISGWEAVGRIVFEMSSDQLIDGSAQLNLGKGFVLDNVQYYMSDESTDKARTQLMKEAMVEFQQKAQVATEGFGFRRYQLSDLSVNDEWQRPQPVFKGRAMASMEMASDYAMPLEGGDSQMSVSVSGRICLSQ